MEIAVWFSCRSQGVLICNRLNMYDNLVSLGPWTYAYDAANRLTMVSSNGVPLVTNADDAQGRRVRKATPGAITTFFYDDWNLVEERIACTNGTTSTIQYHWGTDLSGSLHGAGGIGGLLYLKRNGTIYVPLYDANGNVTKCLDANGSVVASYTYDAFGNLLSQSGDLADTFAFRFSTKYYDAESGLTYFGRRFYLPSLRRWLNRDPLEEQGGVNLYGFCGNNALVNLDKDGHAYFAVRGLGKVLPPIRWSFFVSCPFMKFAVDLAADILNVELVHEQLFYEDGSNIGWGNDDMGLGRGEWILNESQDRYIKRDGGYDDCVMRMAEKQVTVGHYQLTWIGRKTKCNCQDYADMLRAKYRELIRDKKVRCKCRLK